MPSPFDFGKTHTTKTYSNAHTVAGNGINKYQHAKNNYIFGSNVKELNVDGGKWNKSNSSPFSPRPPSPPKKVSLASPTINKTIHLVQKSPISSPFSSKSVTERRVSFASPIVTSRWTPSEVSSFGGPFGTTMKGTTTSNTWKTNHYHFSTMSTGHKNGFSGNNIRGTQVVDRRCHGGGILKKNNSVASPPSSSMIHLDSASTTTSFPFFNTTKTNIFMNHHTGKVNNTHDKSRSELFVFDSTTSPQIRADTIKPPIFTTPTNNKQVSSSSNDFTSIFNPTPSFNKDKESSKKIYLQQSNKKKSVKKACKSSRSPLSNKTKLIIIRHVKPSRKHQLNHSRKMIITSVERKEAVTSPVVSKDTSKEANEDNHVANGTINSSTSSSMVPSPLPQPSHPNLLSPEFMLAQQLETIKRQTINLTGINTNWDQQLQTNSPIPTPRNTVHGNIFKRESITTNQPYYHPRHALIFSTSRPESSGVKIRPRGFR